jgi:hypothetical protein
MTPSVPVSKVAFPADMLRREERKGRAAERTQRSGDDAMQRYMYEPSALLCLILPNS